MSQVPDVRQVMDAMRAWASERPHGCQASGTAGGFTHIRFHSRPDPRAPEISITFRPAIVDGDPVIQIPELIPLDQAPSPARVATERGHDGTVVLARDATSPRDATAICEGCGALGTVGRVRRTSPNGESEEIHRFCASCWPEHSARYRERWREEDRLYSEDFFRGRVPSRGAGPSMEFAAATWHTTLKLVEQVERSMRPSTPPPPDALARLAAQFAEHAGEIDGEMPFAVAAFIQRYGTRQASDA